MGVAKMRGRSLVSTVRACAGFSINSMCFFIDDDVGFTSCINLRNSRCVLPRVHVYDVSISSIVSPLSRL